MDTNLDLEIGHEKPKRLKSLCSETRLQSNGLLFDSATVLQAITAHCRPLDCTSTPSLEWYTIWLSDRLQTIPAVLSESIVSTTSLFTTIATLAKEHGTLTEMASHLISEGHIVTKGEIESTIVAKSLTFGLLGWMSMLYEPDLSKLPSHHMAIADVLDGYRSSSYYRLTQPFPDSKRTMPDLLLGFGLMLAKENVFTSEDDETNADLEKIAMVTPGGFNAAALVSLAGLKIQWVDVIAPHLELDQATNTFFLYRYASFCVANLSHDDEPDRKGVLHGLALDGHEANDMSQWASESETTGLLREILLSYRLLFAQDKASRRLFKSILPFRDVRPELHDPFLEQICTAKALDMPSLSRDRESYRLSRDFPILRERLALLQQHLNNVKPRSWRDVWRDKRDTAQWWTFWAVIFFGGAGLILSAMQVVLQFVQLFYPRS